MNSIHIFSSRETKPDWQSRAIMKSLKCDYSHVGILFDNRIIYHSTGEGVNKKTAQTFLKDHNFIHTLEITNKVIHREYAIGWCDGNIGKDYSESQYLGFMNKKLRRLVGDGRSEMICSEFAARFIDECTTLPVFDTVDCDFVDPKSFIESLIKVTGLQNA